MGHCLNLARVIGHLMGDGYVNKRYIRYNNKDQILLDNFQENFIKLLPETHFIKGKSNSETPFIQIQNKEFITYLFSLCSDFRSNKIRFPRFINTLDSKKEFISAIFDDEGCVSLRIFKKTGEIKRNLEIGSKSKKFIFDIKNCLEKDFDINCNKPISFTKKFIDKEYTTWKLSITGKGNFLKFRDKIGFNTPIKNKKLDQLINSYIRK
jgi:intein/homing endonuclease